MSDAVVSDSLTLASQWATSASPLYLFSVPAETLAALQKPLDQTKIKNRQGAWDPATKKKMTLSYLGSYYIIDQANTLFGYNGWSYEITDMKTNTYAFVKTEDGRDGEKGKEKNGIETKSTARVKVTVFLGGRAVIREDVGNGSSTTYSNAPDFEGAEKEAVSDALKRALRTFGNQFGNSLYDKEYLGSVGSTPTKSAPASTPKEATPAVPATVPMASEAQRGYVQKLLKAAGKNLSDFIPKKLEELTKADASKLIEDLQKKG